MSTPFSWIGRSQTPTTPWEPCETPTVDGDQLTPERFWKWVDMCKDGDDFGISDDESRARDTADERSDSAHQPYYFKLDPTSVFDQEEMLGHGQLGMVAKMKIRGSDIVFACKTSTNAHRVQILHEEARRLKDLDHEHIVKFIGTFTLPGRKNYLSLIMFPVGEQNLQEFLRDAKSSEHQSWLKGWFICLASALCYLHNKGIRHEDIKPSNIIHRGNKVLFTDFGSSTEFKAEITTSTESSAYGSPMYEAPEVLDQKKMHGARSDIFSLGCVYVELLTALTKGNVPELHKFCKEQSTNAKKSSGFFLYSSVTGHLDSWFASLQPPIEVTIIWKDIIQLMLREERKERPTAIETLKLLQAGFIPFVMANDRKCCNQRGHELTPSQTPRQIQNSGKQNISIVESLVFLSFAKRLTDQIIKEARHSIEKVDSVDVNFHRLDKLLLLLIMGDYDAIAQHPLPFSAGSVEICFVDTFGLQKSSFESKAFLEIMLHYRMNLNAYGGIFKKLRWPGDNISILYSIGSIVVPGEGDRLYPPSSMLQAAAWWGHEDSIRFLLENGADPNAGNESEGNALHAAAWQGHSSIVKALLNAGANPGSCSTRFKTCLYAAAHEGHCSIVQTLIDAGVDVNQAPGYSESPIAAAVCHGHSTVVRILLMAGANPNSRTDRGAYLLPRAASEGHYDIVHDLLQAGADTNAEAEYGLPALGTALIAATLRERLSVIRLLSEGGAELNRRSERFGTALIVACRKGMLESVRMLIKMGADVNIDAGEHGTAHSAASKHGRQEIVQLLEEAGARSTD